MITEPLKSITAALAHPTSAEQAGPRCAASVIIVTYNGRRYLEACLDSVVADADGQAEVIVVDNASDDGSAALVSSRWPGIRLIANASNAGFSVACNQGGRQASGEVLVFLNQDTQARPGWLAALLRPLVELPQVALVTSKQVFLRRPGQIHACGLDVHFTGLTFLRGLDESAASRAKPGSVFAVSGASFAIRRSVWEELGGFAPDLEMYHEDTDLSWRAQLAGFQSWYAAGSIIRHDQPTAPSNHALYYTFRNRGVLILSNWTVPALLLLAPGLALADMVEWAYALVLGWNAVGCKLRAAGWLVRHLPEVLHRRERIQKQRSISDSVILARCAWRITPRLAVSSRPVRLLSAAVNALFYANYRAALAILQRLERQP